MIIHTLTRRQFVPSPPGEVFGFFSRPENLAEITPPGLGFVILTPRPVAMTRGALIDYTIRFLGVPVRWTTLITSFEHGRSFVDEQLRGPYSFWHHSHSFEEAPGGTVIRDEVRYAMPFGILGSLVHRLVVRRKLASIFDYRASAIGRIFGDEKAPAGAESGNPAARRL